MIYTVGLFVSFVQAVGAKMFEDVIGSENLQPLLPEGYYIVESMNFRFSPNGTRTDTSLNAFQAQPWLSNNDALVGRVQNTLYSGSGGSYFDIGSIIQIAQSIPLQILASCNTHLSSPISGTSLVYAIYGTINLRYLGKSLV